MIPTSIVLMRFFKSRKFLWLASCSLLCLLFVGSCIKNDLPFPRIPQLILSIAVEGESKEAYIDNIAYEVTLYLEETTDIQNVKFTEYQISEDGVSDPNLLEGTYDLSSPLFVTLYRFQEYTWELKAVQDIPRYFQVKDELGESVVDVAAHRVVVTVMEGTDLSNLVLERVKLGPEGITTMSPDLKPGPIDLSYPLRVEVTYHGRTEIWTIYGQIQDTPVATDRVDAWSKVIWAYGSGSANAENGFEYKKTTDSDWIRVPKQYITSKKGVFSCFIPGVEPLTEYVVRAYSDNSLGEEMTVTTQATADIPNGDFEQWHKTPRGMWNPWDENGQRYWDTGNSGSMTLGVNLTTPSDHTPTGTGTAAMCKSQRVALMGMGKLGAGSIFTGEYLRTEGINGVLGFGRPWTLRPTKLNGFYQYSAKTIDQLGDADYKYLKGRPDSCHIYVALTDWTAPYEIHTKPSERVLFDKNASYVIGYGELTYSGEMSAYEPFEIKITYKDTSKVPSYMVITCAASKYGDYFTGGDGSTLYVDQLSFGWDLP